MEKGGALLGDDESMPGREGIDVEKGEHVLVFVHPIAGDLAVEDPVEDCRFLVTHGTILAAHPARRAPLSTPRGVAFEPQP